MKISKLFHWLYAILMFLPFGFTLYLTLVNAFSGNISDFDNTFDSWLLSLNLFIQQMGFSSVSSTIYNAYEYLVLDIFGLDEALISMLLTYWTCISIIWLIFDVFMYVPLLVHRWIDKAKIE